MVSGNYEKIMRKSSKVEDGVIETADSSLFKVNTPALVLPDAKTSGRADCNGQDLQCC